MLPSVIQMQDFPPNAEQLAEMVRDAMQTPGSPIELTFGNSLKVYSLVSLSAARFHMHMDTEKNGRRCLRR